MSKLATTTFLVSDVAPATTALEEVPYKEAIETLLKTAVPSRRSRLVEACARYHGQLIAGVPFHPAVAAAHRAFMDHRPLCLSPDTIWLMICQGVANHVNANAEELRSRFVSHEGKIQISVRRDDFVKGSPENPWADAIEELTQKVREHIGSAFDLFRPAFTTTGRVEKAAAAVVLLDAMQSYFDYDIETFCGIPAITLEGTPEDWQDVADRAERFGSLDLEWWLEPLRAVLHQFVAAAQGMVDRPFWQSFYKYQDESGGPMITGWISALFPYLKDSRTGLAIYRNPYLTADSQRVDDFDDGIDDEIDDIDIDEDGEDEIEDNEFDQEDERIEKPAKDGATAAPQKKLNRLILRRKQDMEDPNAKDAFNAESRSANQPPSRIIPIVQDDVADRDLDDDFDGDDDDELVVGAWLRPMPRRKWNNEGDDLGFGWGPRISELPSGISRAPFHWDYLEQSFDMEFLGGFVGVAQDQESLTLRPEIGWAVRERLPRD
ncbi:MAG: DUF4419 domain-containing protein [Isosphaeraceae bacterium]